MRPMKVYASHPKKYMRPIKVYASQKNIYLFQCLAQGPTERQQNLIIFGIGFASLPINVGKFCYYYESGETYIGKDTRVTFLYWYHENV